MDLLILSDKVKLHYVYIKDFNKFRTKTKNIVVNIVYSVLTVKEFW